MTDYEKAVNDGCLYANWLCDQKSPLELAYIIAYLRFPYDEKDIDWIVHCQKTYRHDLT